MGIIGPESPSHPVEVPEQAEKFRQSIPAGVKRPEDHRSAAADTVEDIVVTVRGIEVTITAEARDDFELLDDMGRVDDGDITRAPSVLRRLVGGQYPAVMDACRDPKTGRVSIESATEFIGDIFKAFAPNS